MNHMRPIESDALRTIVNLYFLIQNLCPNKKIVIRADKAREWKGCFSRTAMETSIFSLFEWLLRLPSAKQMLSVFVNDVEILDYMYPENPGRDEYRAGVIAVEVMIENTAAWQLGHPPYLMILQNIFNFEYANDALHDLAKRIVRSLPGSEIVHKSMCITHAQGNVIELSCYHPLVILSRLHAVYTIAKLLVKKTGAEAQALSEVLAVEAYICRPIKKFYKVTKGESTEYFVLDRKHGYLSSLVYCKQNPYSSVCPIYITSITDNLVCDIRKIVEKRSGCGQISIFLAGSIKEEEMKRAAEMLLSHFALRGTKPLRIEFNAFSGDGVFQSREYSEGNQCVFVQWGGLENILTFRGLEENILRNDLAYIVDCSFLYSQYNDTKNKDERFVPWSSDLAVQVMDCYKHVETNSLESVEIYRLNSEMIDTIVTSVAAKRASSDLYKNSCITVVVGKLNADRALNNKNLAGRLTGVKEGMCGHDTVTILQFADIGDKAQNKKTILANSYDANKSPSFVFTLRCLYQIIDPAIGYKKYSLVSDTNIGAILDHIVCHLYIEHGKWVCDVCPVDGEVQLSSGVLDDVKNFFAFLTDPCAFPYHSRTYLYRALAHVLEEDSTDLVHLILMNTILNHELESIEVNVSDVPHLEFIEALVQCREKAAQYENKCVDAMVIRKLGTSSSAEEHLISMTNMFEHFNIRIGFGLVRDIEDVCCNMLSSDMELPKSVNQYCRKVMKNARAVMN